MESLLDSTFKFVDKETDIELEISKTDIRTREKQMDRNSKL